MSILVNKDSKILCQGITGNQGSFHTEQCIEYGTQVVGGVTPGRGGEECLGVPVFDTMKDAVAETGLRDVVRGRVISVPGAVNRVVTGLSAVIPRPLLRMIATRVQRV